MAELKAFLREAARQQFVWGTADCLLLGADWVRAVEGWDPAVDWRGTYDSEDEARAIIQDGGGLPAMITAAMRRQSVPAAGRGDVGLICTRGPDGPQVVVGICCGERWAARSPRGLWIGRTGPLSAWKVG